MHATIYHGGSKDSRQDKVITTFDPNNYHIIQITPAKNSISIKQIHALKASTTTIPQTPRIIWIEEAGKMTKPAQNALLKILEEPPAKTSFILTLENANLLLPTIRSRCTNERVVLSEAPILNTEPLDLIKTAMQGNEGSRIALSSQTGKKREEASNWINSLIQSLNIKFKETNNPSQLTILHLIIKSTLSAEQKLANNCNVSLTMQHFFLSLPKTK